MADRVDAAQVAVAGGQDRFEDLPEHVLELLLSFLSSRDAVRTSVLARRWRARWKSVPALRLDPSHFQSVHAFDSFVNKLLEYRDRTSPLHECDISSYPEGNPDEAHRDAESWVQYAVSCQASVLRVGVRGYEALPLNLSSSSVVSKHLTRLVLYRIVFDEDPVDVFSCQALEVLDIDDCFINLGDVLPKSLRHLKIIDSTLISEHRPRNCLSAPGLLTFQLDGCQEWAPMLESLPSLVTSFIRIDLGCRDDCDYYKYLGDCGNESCDGCYGQDNCSVLLEGLSGATDLELISERSLIFRKDLKWSPVFAKLKSVLLNDWCVAANFTGLVYLLRHSPIIERLTLQLSDDLDSVIKSSESYNPMEYFSVSKHLKVVEIYCCKEDDRISQILEILGTHGVTPAQINIEHGFRSSSCFSFEQRK